MMSRVFRVSLTLIAVLFAAGCAGGTDIKATVDEALNEPNIIATFDVGYVEDEAEQEEAEQEEADPAPDGLPMVDEGDQTIADDSNMDPSDSEPESWPADANLRDDGLLFVRSPAMEDGRWKSISLVAPGGEVVWSYEACSDTGCAHDDILVLPNGNVAITATSTVDGMLVDNVLELEPVIGQACATADWCTGVVRRSTLNTPVPEGLAGSISLVSAADDYTSWEVRSATDGTVLTVLAS